MKRVRHPPYALRECALHGLTFPDGRMMVTRQMRGSGSFLVNRYARNFHSEDFRSDLYAAMADLGRPVWQIIESRKDST